MRIVIVRPMPNFSMDVYANGVIEGLQAIRPDWEIVDLSPKPVDRSSRSVWIRLQKAYERFWHFPKVIREQQADIYHIVEAAEAHAVYGLSRKSKASVVTCHDLINFRSQDNLRGSVQLPFLSRYLWLRGIRGMEKANHILTVSDATAKEVTEILDINPSQVTVTPNGVSSVFKPLSDNQIALVRQQRGLSPDTLCLLNVGSDHPRKNILNILKAVEKLKQQGLSVCFWKVSADFTEEQKAFILDHGLTSHVAYLGKPEQSELVQLYNAADILVAPSFQEGFGLTIIEAMATGTAVITSNVSAMPEVAGGAAILVDPADVDAITAAIKRICHDDAYKHELVQKGLNRAKDFTWQANAEQVAQVYENLMLKAH